MADGNAYTFVHEGGDIFVGTRIQFAKRSGISASRINSLISRNVRKSLDGWSAPQVRIATSNEAKAAKQFADEMSGKKYKFINMLAETRVMTKNQLQKLTGMDWSTVNRIVDGGEALSGWATV